jgi:Protein phosphatase 2C
MLIRVRTQWLPKAGNSLEEYEDAFWPDRPLDCEACAFRCAVADGATEASFSGMWSRILVRAWCRGQLEAEKIERHLPHLRRAWRTEVGSRPLAWYAEEKVRSGAFSSVLGLHLAHDSPSSAALERAEPASGSLRPEEPAGYHVAGRSLVEQEPRPARGIWRAIAVGDTCLFQVRGRRLLRAFPLVSSRSFGSTPHLVCSVEQRGFPVSEHVRVQSGVWQPGDYFLLMTDALGAWYLRMREQRRAPRLPGEEDFAEWAAGQRQARALRNDDVTLMKVDVGG